MNQARVCWPAAWYLATRYKSRLRSTRDRRQPINPFHSVAPSSRRDSDLLPRPLLLTRQTPSPVVSVLRKTDKWGRGIMVRIASVTGKVAAACTESGCVGMQKSGRCHVVLVFAALTFVDFDLGDVSHGSGNCLPRCHNTRNSALSRICIHQKDCFYFQRTHKAMNSSCCSVKPSAALLSSQPATRPAAKYVMRKKKKKKPWPFFPSPNPLIIRTM